MEENSVSFYIDKFLEILKGLLAYAEMNEK